jgi:hypothetical protein
MLAARQRRDVLAVNAPLAPVGAAAEHRVATPHDVKRHAVDLLSALAAADDPR